MVTITMPLGMCTVPVSNNRITADPEKNLEGFCLTLFNSDRTLGKMGYYEKNLAHPEKG